MAGCCEYSVTPMFTACYPVKCCDDVSLCYPCLPHYIREPVYKEKKLTPPPPPTRHSSPPRICHSSLPPCYYPETEHCCKTCSQPCCQPVKTKYIIPCYRYEDGRIEQYVPTRHGRLPLSAYRRNGIQDQIHGYRGAQRYLCASHVPAGCCVCTAIEPIRRVYPKISMEVQAIKGKKDKNGCGSHHLH